MQQPQTPYQFQNMNGTLTDCLILFPDNKERAACTARQHQRKCNLQRALNAMIQAGEQDIISEVMSDNFGVSI